MKLTMEAGLLAPNKAVLAYLEAEQEEEGLLEDVKTIKTTTKSDTPTDLPAVWVHEHPTIAEDGRKGSTNLSHTQFLMTPFEFICIEYDDMVDCAADKAKNLATRVGASILNNYNIVKDDSDTSIPPRLFTMVRFNTLIPDGEVTIAAKKDIIPAASIIFDFVYPIRWLQCKR